MRIGPLAYAVLYAGLSLGIEIVLIVVFRMRIPRDNAIVAPVVLTVPPLTAAWLARCRSAGGTAALAALTALLTIVVTMTVTRLTGRSVGLLEPLLSRPIAGFLAAVAFAWAGRQSVKDREQK